MPNLINWSEEVQKDLSQVNVATLGKVGVLLGGKSGERDISLMSGKGVLDALISKGVNAHAFDSGQQAITELVAQKFDRVFIALHGRYGEDGTMQGLLEQMNLPYTGSGVLASALAIDKQATKRLWSSFDLATPRFAMLNAKSDWQKIIQDLGLPIIVKPAREGSSLGLSKVTKAEDLPAAYALAAKLDRDVMAEQCIIGEELTCPIVGDGENARALPVIRIVAPDSNYDYHNKYFSDDTKYLCPTGLDLALETKVQELALSAYRALGCKGWGRADVMIDRKTNQPYLLEMNTAPGMTGHSLVPMAAKAAGVEYADLVLWLLSKAGIHS
ncbi:D-alanine--D-alanine ligase [Polynucleobacter sp. AM-26B4]|uniref:D-alanine--D-alanine ligase n=1 Tax=Polynucleobacter sp. AM-26B4 TaxID=2689103 RepID=UPI001C0AF36D|nr:D-alanine--D-alanine ligase [Polynucleobacter sp. AM-26B4]MBU3585234.1 D-alanine--D-alanine ligase [Polynucleobacter sp. AM-26B4]